jgi:hypothetical protein
LAAPIYTTQVDVTERWMEDAKALSLLHPEVELSYWCTEPPR